MRLVYPLLDLSIKRVLLIGVPLERIQNAMCFCEEWLFFSACVSPSDPTLTVENVRKVMREVSDWEEVATILEITDFVREIVKDEASERVKGEEELSEREASCLLGEYWVNADPDASWEKLSMALYHAKNEDKATAMAKQHLPQGMAIYLTT